MEINDASMRVNFSIRQIQRMSDLARRDASMRVTEPVVMTGDSRLTYSRAKNLVSQRQLTANTQSDIDSLQRAFAESRSSLYKRLVDWFDDLPCNCGDTNE